MMLVTGFLIILIAFLLFEAYTSRLGHGNPVDNSVLEDQILAYHLDWNAIQDRKFLTYLYVKKVNAVVRYQTLAGVSYEQAQDAIEHLLAHPELLPGTQYKRRPPLPYADDQQLWDLIAEGELAEATSRYAQLVGVDQFTAQKVVKRMQREQFVTNIIDQDIERLVQSQEESSAVTVLQDRYGLTEDEAIQAIDAMIYAKHGYGETQK